MRPTARPVGRTRGPPRLARLNQSTLVRFAVTGEGLNPITRSEGNLARLEASSATLWAQRTSLVGCWFSPYLSPEIASWTADRGTDSQTYAHSAGPSARTPGLVGIGDFG